MVTLLRKPVLPLEPGFVRVTNGGMHAERAHWIERVCGNTLRGTVPPIIELSGMGILIAVRQIQVMLLLQIAVLDVVRPVKFHRTVSFQPQ